MDFAQVPWFSAVFFVVMFLPYFMRAITIVTTKVVGVFFGRLSIESENRIISMKTYFSRVFLLGLNPIN